jgi:hypothetical protein
MYQNHYAASKKLLIFLIKKAPQLRGFVTGLAFFAASIFIFLFFYCILTPFNYQRLNMNEFEDYDFRNFDPEKTSFFNPKMHPYHGVLTEWEEFIFPLGLILIVLSPIIIGGTFLMIAKLYIDGFIFIIKEAILAAR